MTIIAQKNAAEKKTSCGCRPRRLLLAACHTPPTTRRRPAHHKLLAACALLLIAGPSLNADGNLLMAALCKPPTADRLLAA